MECRINGVFVVSHELDDEKVENDERVENGEHAHLTFMMLFVSRVLRQLP